jgi:hypothetical protein
MQLMRITTLVLVWPGHESREDSHVWLSLLNSHQLSCDSCSRLHNRQGTSVDKTLVHANSRFSTLINSHATLVLVWPRGMRVEKTLMQTLASQLSSTLMQLLFSFYQGMRVEKTLMQTLNSHATLVPTFSFDRGKRVEKTLMQTLTSQLSCNSCSRFTGAWESRRLSCLTLTS